MKITFVFFTILLSFSLHAQTIWYVDINASGANNGSSWGNAFKDLQLGLVAANYGDEIWVAEGVYIPSKNKYGTVPIPAESELKTFKLPNGVKLYGGFKGNEQFLSQRNWEKNKVIISYNQDVIAPILIEDADSTTLLDGINIKAGLGYHSTKMAAPSNSGSGINIMGSSPLIKNVIIDTGKVSINDYSAIHCLNSSPVFINVTVQNLNVKLPNSVYGRKGGGVINFNSQPVFINCVIYNNKSQVGGGMYNSSSSVIIINSLFDNNWAEYTNVIHNDASELIIVNSTFVGNRFSDSSGPMYSIIFRNTSGARTRVYNSIITELSNVLSRTDSTIFYNCLIDTNGAQTNLIMGYDGGGNIGYPVHFTDTLNGNYRLQSCSPALDTGNLSYLLLDEYDLDSDGDITEPIPIDLMGNVRVQGAGLDLGAIEGPSGTNTLRFPICRGDSVKVNGITYYQHGMHTFRINRPGHQCDSLLIYHIHNAVDVRVALDMNGQSLYVADSSARYQWYDCTADSVLINDTNQRFIPSQIGTYAAIITKDGCTDTSACFTINQVSVKEYQQKLLSYVYPNPSRGVFEVKLNPEVQTYQWQVYDLSGRIIQQGNGKSTEENLKVNLSPQTPGVYVLQIATNQGVVRVKLVKD